LLSSFTVFLILVTPTAFADSFDEKTCLSLISTDKVQNISGYDKTLDARIITANLENLNEGITNGCVITFEREGLDFGLTVIATASDSERTAQSKYGDVFSASHQSGYEVIEGNNGPWIHHLVVFNDKGIGSVVLSIKDNIQVGVTAPQTDFLIEPSAILEILKLVQSSVDKLEIPISSDPTNLDDSVSVNPNDVEPTNVEPEEITSEHEQKIVELEPPTMEMGKLLSPLEQFRNDIPYYQIECNLGLLLTQKYDGSPACVKSETVFELIKRGWVSDIIVSVQSRVLTLDPEDMTSSYMDKIIPTLDDFKNILSEPYDIDTIFSKLGDPHYDIGSGIHVYVYDLNDDTQMLIGYNGNILYITNLDLDGNVLEELFVNNNP
jgi:hypothetical protein